MKHFYAFQTDRDGPPESFIFFTSTILKAHGRSKSVRFTLTSWDPRSAAPPRRWWWTPPPTRSPRWRPPGARRWCCSPTSGTWPSRAPSFQASSSLAPSSPTPPASTTAATVPKSRKCCRSPPSTRPTYWRACAWFAGLLSLLLLLALSALGVYMGWMTPTVSSRCLQSLSVAPESRDFSFLVPAQEIYKNFRRVDQRNVSC
jgi:hypothetical protein